MERKKTVSVRSIENAPSAQDNVTRKAVAARSGQKGSAVVFEYSVGSASEAGAGVTPANVSSVQVKGDVGSQRTSRGAGTHREEQDEMAVVAPGFDCQGSAAAADAVAVALPS